MCSKQVQKNKNYIVLNVQIFLPYQFYSPLMHLAICISFGIIVTCLTCMAHKFMSSKRDTMYASHASWRQVTASIVKREAKMDPSSYLSY